MSRVFERFDALSPDMSIVHLGKTKVQTCWGGFLNCMLILIISMYFFLLAFNTDSVMVGNTSETYMSKNSDCGPDYGKF